MSSTVEGLKTLKDEGLRDRIMYAAMSSGVMDQNTITADYISILNTPIDAQGSTIASVMEYARGDQATKAAERRAQIAALQAELDTLSRSNGVSAGADPTYVTDEHIRAALTARYQPPPARVTENVQPEAVARRRGSSDRRSGNQSTLRSHNDPAITLDS